jgi:hypothetical protein
MVIRPKLNPELKVNNIRMGNRPEKKHLQVIKISIPAGVKIFIEIR